MFRLWGKEWKKNHMIRDTVVEMPGEQTRTEKVLGALQEVCLRFDLHVPIWLDSNIQEFQKVARTRFTADSFTEEIPFDFLEIQMIEED